MVLKPNTNGCVVVSGRLVDPYADRTIPFVKGDGDAATWPPPDKSFR